MISLTQTETHVLKCYPRAVAHMRAEIVDARFGLIFGAGVSTSLGFPNWSDLVSLIAAHPDVAGQHLLVNVGAGAPSSSKTQMLFQHYRSKVYDQTGEQPSGKIERRIQGQWRRIIHDVLYREVPTTPDELMVKHPYLSAYLPVISGSSMTVNYNFDDTIQQLLLLRAQEDRQAAGRSFETVWNAQLPGRPGAAIIYHPNGFLPRNLLEYPSETLVFSEDSFADQLIESMAGHHASLLHHLSKTTCLFVGLSLQDATLRHLLRQSAVINPGHYHYYVHYLKPGTERDEGAEAALRDVNFEVHNLITLFLGDDEIQALGRLLTLPEQDLMREAEEAGANLKYCYYITGPIGAGKTTSVTYLGSLKTYEEWTEARLEELGKPWTELDDDERKKVDNWLVRQFNRKNYALLKAGIGLHITDRSPLDPISFTKTEEVPSKAKSLSEGISPGDAKRTLQPGHVILLEGDPNEMEARVIGRHKQSRADVIDDMQKMLHYLFREVPTTNIDTTGLSVHRVVKHVSRAIFLDSYRPVDLSSVLAELQDRGL